MKPGHFATPIALPTQLDCCDEINGFTRGCKRDGNPDGVGEGEGWFCGIDRPGLNVTTFPNSDPPAPFVSQALFAACCSTHIRITLGFSRVVSADTMGGQIRIRVYDDGPYQIDDFESIPFVTKWTSDEEDTTGPGQWVVEIEDLKPNACGILILLEGLGYDQTDPATKTNGGAIITAVEHLG